MSEVTTALSPQPSASPEQQPSGQGAAPATQATAGSPPAATGAPEQKPAASGGGEPLQYDRWRELVSAGDDKVLQELTRYKSPADIGKQLLSQKQELSKRAQPVTLPKDATPEQVAAYREAIGVPKEGTVEAYGIKAPDGYALTESDKVTLAAFAKEMHEVHAPPSIVHKAVAKFFEVQQETAKAQSKIDSDKGRAWNEEREQERGRDDKALLAASRTFLQNHPWIKGQENPEAALLDLVTARLPGGGLLGDHPLFHAVIADAALKGGYGDRIMANELEAGSGKSLAEQQSEIEALRFKDSRAYDAAQPRLEKIIAARIARGEIDENGRPRRAA